MAVLWSSEGYTLEQACVEALASVYRLVYILQHGYARTLGELPVQIGVACIEGS